MEQQKNTYDFYSFPEGEFIRRAVMTEPEAMAYCVRFDLTMRRQWII
jgi:hypothetical protein